MKFTVTKKIEDGKIALLINNKNITNNMVDISREITGTTKAAYLGVFTLVNHDEEFEYGSYRKKFPAMPETKYDEIEDGVEKIAACIQRRVQVVRDWVRSIEDREETVTVTVTDTGEPSFDRQEDRIKALLALGNRAKNNGADYDIANACWALAMVLNAKQLGRQTYEAGKAGEAGEARGNTYYDLATISSGDEYLCIPVPLLSRDWAINFAGQAKSVARGDHSREPGDYDEYTADEINSELRSLVTATEAEKAKDVLEGDNKTLESLTRKRRIVHKKVVRSVDDE